MAGVDEASNRHGHAGSEPDPTFSAKARSTTEVARRVAVYLKPYKLMALGTFSLNKGKRKLTITVFNKNPKSSGYHFGLDEIQLVPAK